MLHPSKQLVVSKVFQENKYFSKKTLRVGTTRNKRFKVALTSVRRIKIVDLFELTVVNIPICVFVFYLFYFTSVYTYVCFVDILPLNISIKTSTRYKNFSQQNTLFT